MKSVSLLALVLAGLPATVSAQTPAQATAPAQQPLVLAEKVARWQLARMGDLSQVSRVTDETARPRSWEQAVFWVGMTALADAI